MKPAIGIKERINDTATPNNSPNLISPRKLLFIRPKLFREDDSLTANY